MDTRAKGREYEEMASEYVKAHGGSVIDHNFFFQGGEIDLIAWDYFMGERYLCFIEVKARKSLAAGHPLAAITPAKRNKIIKGARIYLNYRKFPNDINVRFDAISILGDEITWEKNAFSLF